jgi:hypothetical protein
MENNKNKNFSKQSHLREVEIDLPFKEEELFF